MFPLISQSFVGIIVPPIIIPIQDCFRVWGSEHNVREMVLLVEQHPHLGTAANPELEKP